MAVPICSAEQSCVTYGTGKTVSANNSAVLKKSSDNYNIYNASDYLSIGGFSSLTLLTKPSTLEEFKSYEIANMKKEIIAQDPNEAAKLTREEFKRRADILNEKIESTDFEQGFKDYMASRGCRNEQELKVLNSGWMPYNTMDDLINSISTQMRATALTLESNGLTDSRFSALDFNSLVRNADISAIQKYTMGLQFSTSFEDRVDALQGFIESAIDSGAVDISFLHFANAIESAKDNIQIFSDKIKEENLLFRAHKDNFESKEYNEKLIARYQS